MLPETNDMNLLIGTNTADDAGIYRLSDDLALVLTVDILNPVAIDPYDFGQIAAANCISDVYAMGGEPKLALNIVGFPGNEDPRVLGELLKGGAEKAAEAGVTIAGGHSFVSATIMYGLSVIGYIHPDKIVTNAHARPGDLIVLTKPIGVGTMIQAVLVDKNEGVDLEPVYSNMRKLNRDAARAMLCAGANAATDITGYGLAGHLVEMAQASKTGIELMLSQIPFHQGVRDIIELGVIEPGIPMNWQAFSENTVIGVKNNESVIIKAVFGSETSGGLAISLPATNLDEFKKSYSDQFWVIGRVTDQDPGKVVIHE